MGEDSAMSASDNHAATGPLRAEPPPVGSASAAMASRLQLPPGPWATLIDGLCARFPAIDRDTWLDRCARGRVTDTQGRPLAADMPYRAGLQIEYFREVAREPAIPFAERVLYRDARLLVVDKPHFLPVVPAGGFVNETLLGRLQRRFGEPDLVPLHRLDRGTAGVVMFSRERASRDAYQALFRERRIGKRYEALAAPLPGLRFPLLHRSRLVAGEPFFLMREAQGEANSETRIEVIARGEGLWRYGLEPVSGRKHQLRVHMAALGAPIANDGFYPLAAQGEDDFERPLKLLARWLRFVDPVDGTQRCFVSEFEL